MYCEPAANLSPPKTTKPHSFGASMDYSETTGSRQKSVMFILAGRNFVQALEDFKERIRKYESVYESITDRRLHYIKLTDM